MRRAALALLLSSTVALVLSFSITRRESVRTAQRLNSAAERLDALTDDPRGDDARRAAIAWGYAERLRLGLESPFRLVEAAARDPRLNVEERRTVSWALLARIVRGESNEVEAAGLDRLGPSENGSTATGEQHLALIDAAIVRSENPRAAELAVRFAYTLAAAERLVDGAAPLLAAEAAAMAADREIARREAVDVVRASLGHDPLDEVRQRRARRAFYVERPALLVADREIEDAAIALTPSLLDSLRAMRPATVDSVDTFWSIDDNVSGLAPRLFAAGAQEPPSAPLAVTVQRYLPMVRGQAPGVDATDLARIHNGEMLVAVLRRARMAGVTERAPRQAVARLLLAAAVAMRSQAQEPVWFATDSSPSAAAVAKLVGVADIDFDADVPASWRPYFLTSFLNSTRDVRRVLPTLRLDGLHVRFRMSAPADSALAMHDPRTRTLHLPILTAGGTLSHELAHDLDRQSAAEQGLAGYRSDLVARSGGVPVSGVGATGRLAASLRALTEELSEQPQSARAAAERPAEIFATRVDWFVASALAREGISSGFLSAVQDELLTGHVVHPERLRTSGRSRSLLTALEEMTTVASFAREDADPSVETLLRWSLAGPVDRRVASAILRGEPGAWMAPPLVAEPECEPELSGRTALMRIAAESRARGWLRLRARWTPESQRSPWARSVLGEAPWAPRIAEERIVELRDYILVELASGTELPAGLSAYAAPLALHARCG